MSTIKIGTLEYPLVQLETDDLFLSFITDIHLSDRAPGRRMDDYRTAIINKIKVAQEWTNRMGGVCLCGGDVFHIKNPSSLSNSNELINEAIDVFGGFNTGKVYGIVGNHDIQYDRFDTLDNQPLGVLIHAGVYDAMPYQMIVRSKSGLMVEVCGFWYEDELSLLEKLNSGRPKRLCDYRIGMAHAMARPGGVQEMHGHPIIGYDLLEGIDFDCFLWGHDHSRVEPTEVGNCTHFHPGSLSRAALSQDEVDRPVTILGLKFTEEGWGFKEREVPTTPLDAAFRTADKKVNRVGDSSEVQGFIQGMSSSIGSIEVSDPRAVIEELCGKDQKLLDICMEVCEL